MKNTLLFILLLLSFNTVAGENVTLVRLFAEKLRLIIQSSDIETFKNLSCYPVNCTNNIYTIDDIFGDQLNDTKFEEILKINGSSIKVIGPFTY